MADNLGPTQIAGNLTGDPKTIPTANGEMVNFGLAENSRYQDRQTGEWKDGPTTYYDVNITGHDRLAKNVLDSVSKGQRVSVNGNHSVEPYTTKQGEARVGHKIWANDVSPSLRFDPRPAQAQGPESAGPQAQTDVQVDPSRHAGPGPEAAAGVQAPGPTPVQQVPGDPWEDPAFVQQQAAQTAQMFQGPGQGPEMGR